MSHHRLLFTLATLWLVTISAARSAEAQPLAPLPSYPLISRYTAQWNDGTRTPGDAIKGWYGAGTLPLIDGRPLFPATNPVRWLRNNEKERQRVPGAFVEMTGGDRLPGRVLAWRPANDDPANPAPPHLLVEPETQLNLRGMDPRANLRVGIEGLQRIVWKPLTTQRYRPGTVFLLDGRRIDFRTLRWTTDAVRLLTEQGPSTVSLSQIAELHLPPRDPWDAYYRQLALLSPSGKSRLVQIEAQDGLRVTTSTERWQPRSLGDAQDPNNWTLMLQPAWSLDALFLKHTDIRQFSFFAPHEAPLTWLEPNRSIHRAALSSSWSHWQLDSNVQGAPLFNAGRYYGWGLGVHARHELEFALPACVKSFQTRIGLDRAAGDGGCARGLIYLDGAKDKPLFESRLLIGSGDAVDTGRLAIPPTSISPPRLVLVADSVPLDRPANADPLDIRDVFDWLEPQLELDPRLVQDEVNARASQVVPAWEGWALEGRHGVDWQLVNLADPHERPAPCFRPAIELRGEPVKLTKTLPIEAGRDSLVLLISRPENSAGAATLEIRIDGRRLTTLPIPIRRAAGEFRPVILSLKEFQGRQLRIELNLQTSAASSVVDFRGAVLTAATP
jgi:hypothetical protein